MKKYAILAVLLSLAIPGFASDYFQTLNVGNLNVFQKSVLKGPITNTGAFTNTGSFTNVGAMTNTGAFSNTGANSLVGNVYMGTATKISTYTASSGQMSFYNEAVIPLATVTTLNVSGVSTLSGNVIQGAANYKSTFTATTGALALTGPLNVAVLNASGVSTLSGNVVMGDSTHLSTYTASTGAMAFMGAVSAGGTMGVTGVSTLSGNVIMGDSTHLSTHTANTGSLALAGSIIPKQLAKAAILALTPVAVGEVYGCSDCTTVTMCVSTSTTVGEWAKVTDRAAACD